MKITCILAFSSIFNTKYFHCNNLILDIIIGDLIRLILILFWSSYFKWCFVGTKLIRANQDIICATSSMKVRVFCERIGQSLGLKGNCMPQIALDDFV